MFRLDCGLSQVKLFKKSWVVRKSDNSNPGLKVNQVIIVSSIEILFCVSVL